MSHIPAWKRINIKDVDTEYKNENLDDDPLNITTHLATGSLTRREKKRIIKGENTSTLHINKKIKPIKRIKQNKTERLSKKQDILKDQLRYLLEFYNEKIGTLPDEIQVLPSVKKHFNNIENTSSQGISDVVTVWTFSKQKQNWIIKHLFNIAEIPRQYNQVLLVYFKDLRGRGKELLISQCMEKIQEWNEYCLEQKKKIRDLVNGTTTPVGTSESTTDAPKKLDSCKSGAKKSLDLIPPSKDIIIRCKTLLDSWAYTYELLDWNNISCP